MPPESAPAASGQAVEAYRVVVKQLARVRAVARTQNPAEHLDPLTHRPAAVNDRPIAGKHDAVGAEMVAAEVHHTGVFVVARAAGLTRLEDAGNLARDVLPLRQKRNA